jgi:lipopolysaccharide export system protein LptA
LKPLLIKILHSSLDKRFVLFGALYALAFSFFCLHASAATGTTIDTAAKKDENKKIRITADKLIAMIDVGEIEFIGNVKAVQTNTVITADRLKIIYAPDTVKSQSRAPALASIEKIIAQGRVKIIHEDIIAETDRAEYTMKSAVLILSGEGSHVTQGAYSVSGTKFILYRSDGKITVESSEKNRVKAVFGAAQKDK